MEEVAQVKLLAIRHGAYSMYVFKDLINNNLIMGTMLPNWEIPNIQIGEIGFLKYQKVKAGEQYYNPTTEEIHTYRYTNLYILNFVKETDAIEKSSNINL